MRLVTLATAIVTAGLLVSMPVYAEDSQTANTPEAKHEAADQHATDAAAHEGTEAK